MTIDALIMLAGAGVLSFPFLGFPSSWDTILFFVLGVFVIGLGVVVRRRLGTRAPHETSVSVQKKPMMFSENLPISAPITAVTEKPAKTVVAPIMPEVKFEPIKAEHKVEHKQEPKREQKPAVIAEKKSEPKLDQKMEHKTEHKPEVKKEEVAAHKPEEKAGPKVEIRSENKVGAKPEVKTEHKPKKHAPRPLPRSLTMENAAPVVDTPVPAAHMPHPTKRSRKSTITVPEPRHEAAAK